MGLGMFDAPNAGRKVRVKIGETEVDAEVDGYGEDSGDEPFLCATGPMECQFELWKDGVAELLIGEGAARGTWRWA